MYALYACRALGNHYRATATMEMEFQVVGVVMEKVGIKFWSSTKAPNVFNFRDVSLVP